MQCTCCPPYLLLFTATTGSSYDVISMVEHGDTLSNYNLGDYKYSENKQWTFNSLIFYNHFCCTMTFLLWGDSDVYLWQQFTPKNILLGVSNFLFTVLKYNSGISLSMWRIKCFNTSFRDKTGIVEICTGCQFSINEQRVHQHQQVRVTFPLGWACLSSLPSGSSCILTHADKSV